MYYADTYANSYVRADQKLFDSCWDDRMVEGLLLQHIAAASPRRIDCDSQRTESPRLQHHIKPHRIALQHIAVDTAVFRIGYAALSVSIIIYFTRFYKIAS